MFASNTCAVQMLLVAFSRRMCCSRVCSARRKAGLPLGILRNPDQTAGHVALEFVARGKKRGVRAAVAQRHAKALRAADGDVRAEFAGRLDQREREQIRGHRDERAGRMGLSDERRVIVNRAERIGILHQRAEDLFAEFENFRDRQRRFRSRAPSRGSGQRRWFADGISETKKTFRSDP